MNRTLTLSIMLALAAGGSQAMAQNLGPAQVRSTIDQPLLADVPLTGMTGGTGDIHVTLASAEAFARAGLNRDGLPVALNFAVAKGASGQPVVRITSSQPIRDTYLDFLVEVSSGGNSVVREVTMLLDPPGSTPSAAGASVAAGPRPSRTSEVPARVPQEAQPSRAESTPPAAPAAPAPRAQAPAPRPRAQAAPGASASQIGPVQRGETLSAIARDHADGADINQMLVALQKANPDAFYRDNINALKTGAVLRIPSADDVKAQSAAAALTEVRRQNEAWRSGAARSPAVVADAASTGAAQGKARPSAGSDDRLALVPAKEGGDAASTRAGTKNGSGDTQVAGLKQELATSQESVASLRQQGDELKSRVADLEAIKTKNERLISLKDSEIAELQRKLAEAGKAPAAASTPAVAAVPAPSASVAPASTASTTAPVAAASVPKAASTAAAPATTTTTTPLKQTTVLPPSAVKPTAPARATPPVAVVEETPWFMQPWAWGLGGVVVLLLLIALFARRKRPATVVAPVATPSLADRFGDEPAFDGIDGIDPDQREILDALAEHPDDIGLHLELVSLYYGRGDVDHFEAAAEAMYAHVSDPDQPEWRDVVAMGEELDPTHPLFGGVVGESDEDDYASDTYTASTPHAAHDAAALEAFELGEYVTGPDDEAPHASAQKHTEYHFNFDLTPVQRAEAEAQPNAPDVFDVDAPESPYAEPHDTHDTHAATFGEVLAAETTLPDERRAWSFDDVPETTAHATPAEPTLDTPRFDEPPHFDEPRFPAEEPVAFDASPEGFSDDPVDTKLDLARAYLDMGDAEGARLMLDEVLAEGSQMQKDTARRILDDIA